MWGVYEQNAVATERDWYIITFAAKWLGKKTFSYKLPDFKTYKKNPESDKEICQKLWELFNEADIIIAHNGDEFDIKKSNARFLVHGFNPPSTYQTIDTKKLARRYFRFDSNKLDELGRVLGFGRKVNTGGFELWTGCMRGDKDSWDKMERYNRRDVDLLEKVYLKLRPWHLGHPDINVLDERKACPICGGETQKRGFVLTKKKKRQRYQCIECAGWSS